MKGFAQSSNRYTQALAAAQVSAALGIPTVFRLYTEDRANIAELVSRHFDGASIQTVTGLWRGQTERGAVVEIVGRSDDGNRIVALATDIARTNGQTEVLVLRHSKHGLDSFNVRGR